MYIETGGRRCPCQDYRVDGDTARYALADAAPEALGETVGLYGDDGFALAEQRVADWLRWEVQGNTLTLTNLPVPPPAPAPGPVEPALSTEDALVREVVGLRYELDQMRLGGNIT